MIRSCVKSLYEDSFVEPDVKEHLDDPSDRGSLDCENKFILRPQQADSLQDYP